MNKIILMIVFILTSCQGMRVSFKGCNEEARLATRDQVLKNTYEKELWISPNEHIFYINDFINCKKVKFIRPSIEQDFFVKYLVKIEYE